MLEQFRAGAALPSAAIAGAAGAELDYRPSPDSWSVREIANHLCDSEIVAVDRFRRVIAEESPTILVYDQAAWAKNLDYQRRSPSQALDTFRHMRRENYALLKELPAEAFRRGWTHSVRGPQTLLDLLRTYAEHVELHAQQIRATRGEYKRSRTSD